MLVASGACWNRGVHVFGRVSNTTNVLEDWGYRDSVLHTDGEPSIVALVEKVKEKRTGGRTLLEQGPRYSHQSQGYAEQGCKALEGQVRTFLHFLGERTGIEFGPSHPVTRVGYMLTIAGLQSPHNAHCPSLLHVWIECSMH